jgi:phospholipid/cholesterol/gamma-HCH transport system permease protein
LLARIDQPGDKAATAKSESISAMVDATHEHGMSGQPLNVSFNTENDQAMVVLAGSWITRYVGRVNAQMRKIEHRKDFSNAVIDLSGVDALDTAGAWLVDRMRVALEAAGKQVEIRGLKQHWETLFDAVGKTTSVAADANPPLHKPNLGIQFLDTIGRTVINFGDDFIKSMHVLGAVVTGSQMRGGKGSPIRYPAFFHQIDRLGVGAIPVVVLISFIMGAIVAQQGAYMLSTYGAETYAVNLVGVLVLRETGVLLTAIMIAGRSGSAITAELGSMKMREEVDALHVIGLNPISVLVFPRLVALSISLPLLTIIADFAGLAGGAVALWLYSDVSPGIYIANLRDAITVQYFLAGLIKAPFMAMIIGTIAAVEGMKVGGSAESLGLRVTASVVKSIFIVIVLDGVFAIFYASINF